MGKYQSRSKTSEASSRNTSSPYMRGIGCMLMLVVPIFSYALGKVLAKGRMGMGFIPDEWYGRMAFPDFFYTSKGLSVIAGYLGGIDYLPATLVFTVLITIAIGGVLSIVFGYLYNMLAPSRYGPLDVPPPRVKTKKYQR